MSAKKSMGWSYPTSENAKRFGFYNSGCWTVELTGDKAPVYLAGFATWEGALAFAGSLPNEWAWASQAKDGSVCRNPDTSMRKALSNLQRGDL